MKRFASGFGLVLGLALLAGCVSAPPPPSYPALQFSDTQNNMAFNVARIEVIDDYVPPMAPPHIETQAPMAPANAVRQWSNQRLVAAGSNGVLRVHILDASIVETALQTTTGVQGVVTEEPDRRYTGSLRVRLEYQSGYGPSSFAEAASNRSIAVSKRATVNQRDQQLYDLAAGLMGDVDKALQQFVRNSMPNALVAGYGGRPGGAYGGGGNYGVGAGNAGAAGRYDDGTGGSGGYGGAPSGVPYGASSDYGRGNYGAPAPSGGGYGGAPGGGSYGAGSIQTQPLPSPMR